MAKAHPIWSNFTGGEFSPLLEGRVDLAKYFNGCRKLENFLVHPQGPASNRPGFRYIASTKDHNKKSRLIPFEFSEEQAYILEFGDQYIRFWMNKGRITALDSAIEALLHGDGLDASKTIVDSSKNEHTVTAHGDCQIDTDYKKFGTGSIWFPGTTASYVTIPDHASWNMGTGKLCIDHWLRPTEWPDVGDAIYVFGQYDDENNYVIFYIYRGGASDYVLYCTIKSGGDVILNLGGSWSPPLVGTWLHLALIRGWGGNANDWAITAGGKALFTDTVSCTWPDLSGDLYLGHYEASPYPVMKGHMDEICWTKGKTWWEENFTPPGAEYPQAQGGTPYEISSPYLEADLPKIKFAQSADIMWLLHPDHIPKKLSRTGHTSWTLEDYVPYGTPADLLLLLHCNGESGSTDFPDDAKKHVFTAYGTAQVSTAIKKWGTGSLLLDGDSDYIDGVDSEDWDVVKNNTDDWTIHFWAKHVDHAGDEYYISHGTSATARWYLRHLHGSGLNFFAWTGSTSWIDTGYGAEITDTDWHHIALVKRANEYGLYLDGAQCAYTQNNNTVDTSGTLHIGVDAQGTTLFLNGCIDEIQIWKSNIFKAFPKSDNSDTITVPSAEQVGGPFGSEGNYPGCVTFYENRLCFAGTKNKPQTIWMSVPGDYNNLTVGINEDDALELSIAADQVNVIKSIVPMSVLLLGTTGGEWRCGGSSPDEPITPTNIYTRRESGYGFADVQARLVGGVCLFLQKARRKIRELTYDYTTGYSSPDMTILAEHITKPQINEMAYQQEPFSIVWCVRSDGVLLGFTYLREHEVMAWHRHTTEGEFESIAVIPGIQGDELWAVVKRTINSQTKRYVELLESPFDDEDTTTAFFVDSGLSYDGEPTSTIGGLDHLEGEEVTVLADGATHPNKTVSGNSITLDREASKVHVGLGYTSVLQTMRLEAGVREGTAQGRIKRINKVVIRLYKTLGCKVGPDENTLDTIYFRDSSMPMDTPPDLFTGDKEIDYPEGYETDAHITVVQDLPLPITVLALMPRIRTAEGE